MGMLLAIKKGKKIGDKRKQTGNKQVSEKIN